MQVRKGKRVLIQVDWFELQVGFWMGAGVALMAFSSVVQNWSLQ